MMAIRSDDLVVPGIQIGETTSAIQSTPPI